MSEIEIFVRHDAELDALGYFEFIRHRNLDADATVEDLARQPLMDRLRHFRGKDLAGIRSWRVKNYETYLVFYRFDGKRLEILRVKHGAMKFPRALRRH